MIGYKGFDKDFKCRDFQFEVGKTYHHDGDLKVCQSGFHFCDTPFAVLEFYPPTGSRFALVEANGEILQDCSNRKFCTNNLTIVKELSLAELIEQTKGAATNTGDCSAATNTGYFSAATNTGDCSAATNTGYSSTATNTGDCSAATNTGDCSAATNTGYFSTATNTGYRSAATNTGYFSAATNTGDCSAATNTGYFSAATNTGDCSAATNTGYCSAAVVSGSSSIAIVIGKNSKAKAALGCWLVLTEWGVDSPIDVQAFKVDGVNILPNTFYTLKGGLPVSVEEDKS